VGVNVDDFHTAPGNGDFPAVCGGSGCGRTTLQGGGGERVPCENHSGRCACDSLQEISAILHASLRSISPENRRRTVHPPSERIENNLSSLLRFLPELP
jgi:hypothetical protein